MKKIGILITPVVNEDKRTLSIEITTIDMSHNENKTQLELMYEALGCSCVEVVTCDLGDIWVDEVGLFVQNNPILSLDKNLPNIAGAMLFSKGSKEGQTIWFDESDTSDLLAMDSITQLLINVKLIGFTSG